jgi:hypothetical protein
VLKETENPPLVWPQERSIADFQGTWWVAHTRSRNEKAVAWLMAGKDIQYFLPMSWKVSRKKGRTVRSLLPVFSSYLFFCGQEIDRLEALKTNRVATIIPVFDQARLVSQLLPIEKALLAGKTLLPHEYLKAGQKCKVTAGPLMGTEGIVVRHGEKKMRLVLAIEMLGQATSVEIDTEMLEPVEK